MPQYAGSSKVASEALDNHRSSVQSCPTKLDLLVVSLFFQPRDLWDRVRGIDEIVVAAGLDLLRHRTDHILSFCLRGVCLLAARGRCLGRKADRAHRDPAHMRSRGRCHRIRRSCYTKHLQDQESLCCQLLFRGAQDRMPTGMCRPRLSPEGARP